MRENHRWQDWERDVVRRDYDCTRASTDRIAERLGVSFIAVKGQVAHMGLARKTSKKPWSPEQDERLRELMPRHGPSKVAQLMHRSINSVVVRSKRLRIFCRYRDGWYTKQEVTEIFGVDHHPVQSWMDAGTLKASYHHGHRPSRNGAGAWHIDEKDLRNFLVRYPDELTGRRVDIIQIVDILAGLVAPREILRGEPNETEQEAILQTR